MIQLRSFILQRLSAAAEEILGEVEKTITLALYDVQRPKEEHHNHRRKLDSLHQISATESPQTGEEVLQETSTQPSIPQGSNLSAAEVPAPTHTSADTDNNDGNYCVAHLNMIKEEEEEEIGYNSQTQDVTFPSPEGVKSEPETQVSRELQPVSSDCSPAQSENDSSDEEWVQSKGAQTKMRRRKVKVSRRRNSSTEEESQATLPDGDCSSKRQKKQRICPICGKGFQYTSPFIKHIKTHKSTSKSTNELLRHLQSAYDKRPFCDVCGKKFTNLWVLRTHSKIHTGIKDFKCQDCGKSFVQKQHLIVHMRIHTGVRPYHCDICGKAFNQKQSLQDHSRTHTGERSYQCEKCGMLFYTCSSLKTHMRRFSGKKPCDICGKKFCNRGQLLQHTLTHTAGSM